MTQKDYGVLAAALVLTVGLSGCGGGGSDGMMSDTGRADADHPEGYDGERRSSHPCTRCR